MKTEVCIESIDEAILAKKYGVDRVEVCSALDLGGLTPSMGLVKACVELDGPEVHSMIRPRTGGFELNESDVSIIQDEIWKMADLGCHGIVFGFLNSGKIDFQISQKFVVLASDLNLETTFHRAIDFTEDYLESLSELVDLGFTRVLTSGKEDKAIEGIINIQNAKEVLGESVQLMAGSGVNAQNCEQFVQSGVDALHFSVREVVSESVFGMGATIGRE